MDLALISFNQILTLSVLMMIGVFCAKLKMINEETNKQLSNLLLMVVNPLLIFLSYQRPFEQKLLDGLLLMMLLSTISFVINLVVAHLIYRNQAKDDYAIEKFGLIYTNAGFLGIPLINGVFGSEGVFYLTGYLTIFFIFFWTHGFIIMSGKKDFSAIKKALVSPPMIGILLGFIFFVLRIELPQVIYTPLRTLGNINTPLAMLVAGVSISGTNFAKLFKNKKIYAVCGFRLLLLPALTIIALVAFSIPTVILGTLIILAACPVATNIILFAYRYNRDNIYATEIFVATTILSMFTIPLLLLLL